MRLRLRTQLLIATVLISTALTAASLLVVRQSVRTEVRAQTAAGVSASVEGFKRIEQQEQQELRRTAEMLSELPTLKALMTTEHAATIQDASAQFWQLSGTDLLVLAATTGDVMAVHVADNPPPGAEVKTLLAASMSRGEQTSWWHQNNDLYLVELQPITSGSGAEQHALGMLAIGQRIDAELARELGGFARSEIALVSGDAVVATTLEAPVRQQLVPLVREWQRAGRPLPDEAEIAGHTYELASVDLQAGEKSVIRCYLLLSADAAYGFLSRLNRIILALGVLAAIVGAGLVLMIAGAITRPLDNLVGAVRAFAAGDYAYSLKPSGSAEVKELGAAFDAMRQRVVESQRKALEAARLAALGRAAASISHDLRHHLAALVANAEFLHEAENLGFDRDESYHEVQRASEQMTGLIDSLIEVAREQNSITPTEARLEDLLHRAADAVRASPEFRGRAIDIRAESPTSGMFDARKLERAFFNLLLNACQATEHAATSVGVTITGDPHGFDVRVWDHGPGIPETIREHLFEPFVSAAKNNGTGLGLAIASKIIHDHGGEVRVESTSAAGTVILVRLPRNLLRSEAQSRAANLIS